MADYSLVQEKMVELGERLHALGYDGPQEVIEGSGDVAAACKDCRGERSPKIVAEYLKDLHQTFVTRNPDPEGNKDQAVRAVKIAWASVRAALSDDADLEALATNPEAAQAAAAQAAAQTRAAAAPMSSRGRPMKAPPRQPQNIPTVSMGKGMPSFRPGAPAPRPR